MRLIDLLIIMIGLYVKLIVNSKLSHDVSVNGYLSPWGPVMEDPSYLSHSDCWARVPGKEEAIVKRMDGCFNTIIFLSVN